MAKTLLMNIKLMMVVALTLALATSVGPEVEKYGG